MWMWMGLRRMSPPSLRRTLHTSDILSKSNPQWVQRRREEKQRTNQRWHAKQNANPSKKLAGLGRSLKALDLDPDNPEVQTGLYHSRGDVETQLLDVMVAQKKFGKALMGKRNVNPRSKEEVAWILHQKRFRPRFKNPDLLTWMEKQMIRHLHEKDPVRWDLAALSEGFPATKETLIEHVKSPKFVAPNQIAAHDEKIRDNWKELAKGKLEISDELREHVLNHFSLDQGLKSQIPLPARSEMEREIIEKYRAHLHLVRNNQNWPPGTFGNIIAQYNRKVAAKNEAQKRLEGKPEAAQETDENPIDPHVPMSESLFSPKSFDPELNLSGPYRETALLKSRVALHRDKAMTIADFRKNFLDKVTLSKEEEAHPNRSKMKKWLINERLKDQATVVPKELLSEDIIKEMEEERDIFAVPKYNPNLTDDKNSHPATQHSQTIQKLPETDLNCDRDQIEIPTELFKEGALYQVGNCFYDDSGQFLYKVLN